MKVSFMIQHGISLALFGGLATAITLREISSGLPSISENDATTFYNADEIHANVLKFLPSDQIITSDKVAEYFSTRSNQSEIDVYLSDTRAWITEAPQTGNGSVTSLNHRDLPCTGSTTKSVVSVHSYRGPYHAVSSCHDSGKNPAGGYIAVEYSESTSVSFGAGFNIGQGPVQASVGFSLSWGSSRGYTEACNVAGGDKVQVWKRSTHIFARTRMRTCSPTRCTCETTDSWVSTVAAQDITHMHWPSCSAKSRAFLKGC